MSAVFFRIRTLIPGNGSPGNRAVLCFEKQFSRFLISVRASLFSNIIGLKLLQLVFLAEPEVPEEALAITKSDFFVV